MKKSLLALTLLALCPLSQAAESSSAGKTHTLGYGAGWGSIKSDKLERSSDDQSHDLYYYSYQYSSNWAVNVEYMSGDSDGGFLDIVLFPDTSFYDRVEYQAYSISAKGALELSNRWQFYGKLGGHHYKVDHSDPVFTNFSDDGFDVNAAIGFEFRAYNGFGISFELGHVKMGDTEANTQGLHLSYMF